MTSWAVRRLGEGDDGWMQGAHRLCDRLGFERAPDLDWEPLPELLLLGDRHRLR